LKQFTDSALLHDAHNDSDVSHLPIAHCRLLHRFHNSDAIRHNISKCGRNQANQGALGNLRNDKMIKQREGLPSLEQSLELGEIFQEDCGQDT
jgi:hypothetical protein